MSSNIDVRTIVPREVVPFDLAKDLRDKKFEGFCYRYYQHDIAFDPQDTDGLMLMFASDLNGYCTVTNGLLKKHNQDHLINELIAAPTHETVFNWLRYKHNIEIEIKRSKMTCEMVYVVECIKFYKKSFKSYTFKEYFDSYDDAADAGIEYALEHWIK